MTTLESLDLGSIVDMQVHLQNGQVKFIYVGHRVKVTGMNVILPPPGLSESTPATAVITSPFQSFRV